MGPQGKANSATSVMPLVKRIYFGRDALWQKHRLNVVQKMPSKYPVRTLEAMRLLTAISNNNDRMQCAKQLYSDLWTKNQSMTDVAYLTKIASMYNTNINVISDPMIKQKLLQNTKKAASKYKMFGVPSMVVRISKKKEYFFWGIDRFPFIDMLLREKAMTSSPKMTSLQNVIPNANDNIIEFYFDFASPWSFLGYMRLREFDNFARRIVLKPVLLGAMFATHKIQSPT